MAIRFLARHFSTNQRLQLNTSLRVVEKRTKQGLSRCNSLQVIKNLKLFINYDYFLNYFLKALELDARVH